MNFLIISYKDTFPRKVHHFHVHGLVFLQLIVQCICKDSKNANSGSLFFIRRLPGEATSTAKTKIPLYRDTCTKLLLGLIGFMENNFFTWLPYHHQLDFIKKFQESSYIGSCLVLINKIECFMNMLCSHNNILDILTNIE